MLEVPPSPKSPRPPSVFTTQFERAVERWAAYLPPALQESFRADFHEFGAQHETVLDTLEGIWERSEKTYAFDESTGLATRRPFYEYLTTLLNEPPSPGLRAVGVLFIDVNGLKRVNDTCGHQAGDRAIAAIGGIVRESLRVDAYAVGRHGGDEFVAALPLADAVEIDHVAPRVKQRADDPDRQRAWGYTGPIELSISMGGIVYELPDCCPRVSLNSLAAALLTAADALMYESKRDGFIHVAAARFTDKLEVHGGRRVPLR